jgi:hypothetical protein
MGQAFDRDGNVLGDAFGETKREVFDKLMEAHPSAEEIRIKTLHEDAASADQTPMPMYRCHKEVWALHLESVRLDADEAAKEGRETDGSAILVPREYPFSPFRVDAAYVRKHNPTAGGYFVQYKDGYTSFSPADAFESGYTRL